MWQVLVVAAFFWHQFAFFGLLRPGDPSPRVAKPGSTPAAIVLFAGVFSEDLAKPVLTVLWGVLTVLIVALWAYLSLTDPSADSGNRPP
jgi:hypothetical protein